MPPLVLKARHLSVSDFCNGFSRLEVPEHAGTRFGIGVVKVNLLNFHVHTVSMCTWSVEYVTVGEVCVYTKGCGMCCWLNAHESDN